LPFDKQGNIITFMRICYFGTYQSTYPRNNILIEGLRQNKVEVIECCDRSTGIKKYWRLFWKHWKIRNNYDIMIIGFLGQSIIFFAKLISKKPIILDAFVSLYNTNVFDRKICKPKSFSAKYYYFLDKFSCYLADKVLLDTDSHIDYFVKTFNLPKEKFIRIFVGSNNSIFYPMPYIKRKKHKFLVHFHGYLVPFHGAEYIIRAAKILEKEDIVFQFITRFDLKFYELQKLVKQLNVSNINFIETVPYEKLPEYINRADVCLGVFGLTPKIYKVIPNKIFEALACRKALITARTPAIKELLTDRKNCLLTKPGDPWDLADKILELKNNPTLKQKIAQNGYQLFKTNLTPKILGAKLKNILINA